MEMKFSSKEQLVLADEIKNLLQKGVIKESQHEEGEFISPIFPVPKSEDSVRMIINPKWLNKNMPYIHFKMETIKSILNFVTPNCFIAKVDIKDAYYSVQKLSFREKLYQFTCLQFTIGLCSGQRKITKAPYFLSKDIANYCSWVY